MTHRYKTWIIIQPDDVHKYRSVFILDIGIVPPTSDGAFIFTIDDISWALEILQEYDVPFVLEDEEVL